MLAAVRDTSVLILGAGGVGSWLAHALALMGVRQIVVVDPDVVEPANLTRQLYTADAVGTRKIEALGASLREHRPDLAYRGVDLLVTDPADLAALLDGVDVVAGCADQPSSDEAALLVARACVASRTPHTAAVYAGSVVRIGPTWIPRRRPPACHGCLQLVRDRDAAAWSLPTPAEVRARQAAPGRGHGGPGPAGRVARRRRDPPPSRRPHAGHRRARRRARPAHPALLPEPGRAAARLRRLRHEDASRAARPAHAPTTRREEVTA